MNFYHGIDHGGFGDGGLKQSTNKTQKRTILEMRALKKGMQGISPPAECQSGIARRRLRGQSDPKSSLLSFNI
jgi:hypothetical protein